jgi:hypothetical protein
MSDFEDDDIDKIFQEMFMSEDMKKIEEAKVDAIISIEKKSTESFIKELIFITQSLSQAIVHVNEIMLNVFSIEDYKVDDELIDILGSVYKLTEDLDQCMLEIMLEESEMLDDEEEEDE